MCNGHGHLPGCTCGYGGVGHKGKSPGGWHTAYRNGVYAIVYARYRQAYYQYSDTGFRWKSIDEDWCKQIVCDRCGSLVFLIHYNGGYASFDVLGKPWNKHPCYDTPRFYSGSRSSARSLSAGKQWAIRKWHYQHLIGVDSALLGVVIEGELRPQGKEHRLDVRCADGKIYTVYVPRSTDIKKLIGEIVLLSEKDMRMVCIIFDQIIPFLDEPTPSDEFYVVGQMYQHHTFGTGKLLSVQKMGDDYRLMVEFADDGIKNLIASYAKLSQLPANCN